VTDEKDENLSGFSFSDTEKYIIPLLDSAQKKAGKPLKIMLSAWSPPAFMKTNKSRTNGGSLKPTYRSRWAEYLCRYIEEFKKRGYDVERMSLQNEPNAVQEWDSCLYTAQEEKEFLRDFLYPALQSHGLDGVEVFIWDHNKERLFERARDVIDRDTDAMVTGLAYHWYSGDHFDALDLVRQHYPDKKLILSESCLEFSKFDKYLENQNAQRLAHDMIGNLNHGMDAFYDWNILLNEKGGPNHVNNFCDAPYLYHEDTKELEMRRILEYYWHFAHFIRPSAIRLATTKYTKDLEITAWKNPDGKISAVLLNVSGQKLPCVLRMNGEMVSFAVEPESIVSAVIE
jgi:glucosylceramidase